MLGDTGIMIGQLLSLVAVATGFISFQMKTPKGILLFQIITALIFSAHYILIDAMTAAALNFIAAIMCVAYYIRNKRGGKGLFVPIFFTLLVFITSLLTWDGIYSLFIMAGLLVNSVALSLSDPQQIRKLTLIKSPLCLIYNLCVWSAGGTVFEISVLTSAIIALVKNRKERNGNAE
ncbi:MAG: YgjV family protein [Ruminococcaceae bacterium]|nr:YgjV family protein [Oscillospiraceae bacterium]